MALGCECEFSCVFKRGERVRETLLLLGWNEDGERKKERESERAKVKLFGHIPGERREGECLCCCCCCCIYCCTSESSGDLDPFFDESKSLFLAI